MPQLHRDRHTIERFLNVRRCLFIIRLFLFPRDSKDIRDIRDIKDPKDTRSQAPKP
jgi:hypothetical protein